jgi:hypothetical protein
VIPRSRQFWHVAKPTSAENVATALEKFAAEIRLGKLDVRKAILVYHDMETENISYRTFGGAYTSEYIGMIHFASIGIYDESQRR